MREGESAELGIEASTLFGQQLKVIRERLRLTQQDLAVRLADLGHPISRPSVARIESQVQARGVSLDDALAIAAAMGVSPVHLIAGSYTNTALAITPQLVLDPRQARQWIRGQQSLRPEDDRIYYSEVSDDEWVARQQQGMQHLLIGVQDLVDAVVDDDRERAADLIDQLNVELDRQRRWAKRHGGSSAGRPGVAVDEQGGV